MNRPEALEDVLSVLTTIKLARPAPMGLLAARAVAAEVESKPGSLPDDSARPRRVRWSCWDMMDILLCLGGEAKYGDISSEVCARLSGLAPAGGIAPG